MKIEIYKALWGMDGSLEDQFDRIAAAGYEGVEGWFPTTDIEYKRVVQLAERHHLRLIAAGAIATISEIVPTLQHLREYNPVKINIQSGVDVMSFDEGKAFIEALLEAEHQLGVTVMQETHRGKLLYTPWITAAYLREFPEMHITADYSHWVNVCERLPIDQSEAMSLANTRVWHIHGRVGYEEGPQVPDPSAPEYATQLAWHETQWKAIRDAQAARGEATMTFTPEYGPPTYLHTLPHTNVPVADLWAVCLWAANRAREQLSSV